MKKLLGCRFESYLKLDFLAEFAFVSLGNLLANELRFRMRMPAFGQPGEMFIANLP
jgi:hypothetical protein